MRPRLEGEEANRLICMVKDKYSYLSPTELIELLINNHYNELYPRGESYNANTKENKNNTPQ
ncbi:hypothetical protein NVP1084O_243 [Vibrio phage 1.084.O._10N.261.49.F5]|nr:hypothetical protein NVP1084O_243 [Vibrio phage 1.084.O._10N.261.49.F5]